MILGLGLKMGLWSNKLGYLDCPLDLGFGFCFCFTRSNLPKLCDWVPNGILGIHKLFQLI